MTGRSNAGSGRSAAWVPATTSSRCRPSTTSTTKPRLRVRAVAGQVCVMIHTGSRGLGHQICTDHVDRWKCDGPFRHPRARSPAGVCPVRSPEGQAYLAAMAAAANYGRANRQLLTETPLGVFDQATSTTLDVLYDVSHNLAKLETIPSTAQRRNVCVHRKGATRSLPPHHPDVPADLVAVGQPVLIPGTMGTASYVLMGVPDNPAFLSTAHGAGRVQSRTRPPATPRATRCAGASNRPGSSSAAAPNGGSPRRSPSPIRTSTPSSRPVTAPDLRVRSRGLSRWEP